MAVQADVLTARQNLENADAQIQALQSQIESARQKLIVMTGWKQNDTPDIRPMPEVDFNRIAAMNLGRKAILFEIAPEWCDFGTNNLNSNKFLKIIQIAKRPKRFCT